MPVTIAVLKETRTGERRVAASPDTVKKLVAAGAKVQIESRAGLGSDITDEMYKNAGATISKSATDTLKGATIILKVQAPEVKEVASFPEGALLITQLNPYQNEDIIKALASAKVDAFAMELVPRITRAQSMDVLSSQSNLAGYKAVLDACEYYGRALPMMMTAAGTVPPAKVFVMGAGVAGLQAIATAKRLGAVVSATDVRPAAKEQVQSLGGSFVAVEDEEFKAAEAEGGYAKEMSREYKDKQAELIAEHVKKMDIVITTALIPGKPAPKLITAEHIKSMKQGSVIVDLAAVQGGNTALTKSGEVATEGGVTIVGHDNFPSRLAADSSALYAKNLLNLLTLILDKDSGDLGIDWEDDIIKGVGLTKGGTIVHPNFKDIKVEAPKPSATSKSPSTKATGGAAKKTTATKTATAKKSATAKKTTTTSTSSDKSEDKSS